MGSLWSRERGSWEATEQAFAIVHTWSFGDHRARAGTVGDGSQEELLSFSPIPIIGTEV